MATGMVDAAGARLLTRVDGPEGAPALLLSNSLASDHTMWDGQMAMLTRRYRVIRYDTRGHGRSDAPEGAYDFPMLVADAVAVLDHHRVARATFMGLSLGGMTGLGLAIHHPGRVEALLCCDARADSPEPVRRMWDERIAAVRAGGMAAVAAATLDRWLVPAFRSANPDATARIERMILATPPAGYIGCAAALKGLDYLKDLPRIGCPALFLGGAQDAAASPEVMAAMAAAVPGARHAVVPDAAHLPNIDNAPGFDALIRTFLNLD
jgi:3-oxoadipate enol-lactonase